MRCRATRTLALATLLATASSCRTLAEERSTSRVVADDGRSSPAIKAPPREDASAEPTPAPPEEPLAWGTRAPKDGVLFPIVDGMCIHGDVYALENGPLFAYGTARGAYSRGGATTTAFVTDGGLEPQASVGFGATFDFWGVTAIGGHYPDRLWAVVDVSSRMVSASELRVGTSNAADWKVVIDSGAEFGSAGNAAKEGAPVHALGAPVPLPDGSVLVPESVTTRAPAGESAAYSFRLVDANGKLVEKPKVPGADLAKIAMYSRDNVVALANGEVLGMRSDPTMKLVRWSPAKPVDDLPITAKQGEGFRLLAGKTRAFLRVGDKLFVYDGTKLEPAKVSARLAPGFTFAVGANDTLYVALADKKLLTEAPEGTISEEPLPAAGKLTASTTSSALWLVSDKDRVLHRRVAAGKAWEPVPLPPPPFGNDLRGPLTVESIKVLAGDDVFVNARRFEKGWGWKQPEPYRVLYRTKRPKQVLRCQDVRNEGTGTGVHAWPPAASDACTTPFVVVMREEAKTPAKTYPALAAALRGKTEHGDKLSFVSFEGRGSLNLGIPMSDTQKARTLATYLSRSLDIRADVVCGRPTATTVRTLDYDVAKGALTASPAPAP